MNDFPQRRYTDTPEGLERLVRLETDVMHVKSSVDVFSDRLEVHMSETGKSFIELRHTMSMLANSIEKQVIASNYLTDSTSKMSDAIQILTKADIRINSLEEAKARCDVAIQIAIADREKMHEAINRATERVDRLYWLVPLVVTVVAGAWELFTHFKII